MRFLVFLIFFSCVSGNTIRNKINANCENITLPKEAFVNPATVREIRGDKYMPVEPYNVLGNHAYNLRLCAESLKCGIRWTEWERDCEISKTGLDRLLGGSCKVEKPRCRV